MKILTLLIVFLYGFNSYAQIREIDLFLDKRDKRTLERELPKFLKTYKLPGVTFVLANKGRIVFAKSYGLNSAEKKDLLEPKHKMAISGCTQVFTAVAIMKLLQEGKVSLEDSIFGPKSIFEKEIPSVKKFESMVTVRHLLEQTVGNDWPNYNRWINFNSKNKLIDIKYYLERQKLNNEPGEEYYNSEFCYLLLGQIIEKKSGKEFIEYIREIFKDIIQTEVNLTTDAKIKDLATHHDYRKFPINLAKLYVSFNPKEGLVCSPVDFMNVLLSIDGNPAQKDILIDLAVRILKAPSPTDTRLGKGWFISPSGSCYQDWYTGGSCTAFNVRSDGLTWVMFANGTNRRGKFNEVFRAFGDELIEKLKEIP